MAIKLWGVDQDGLMNEKQLDHLIDDLKIYWRIFHGPDVGLEKGDTDLQTIQSVSVELRNLWTGILGAYLQTYISLAVGASLDLAVDILGMSRKVGVKAIGEATFSRTTPAPGGGITIPAGTVIATESGIQFVTDVTTSIPAGQTSITVAITATSAEAEGNVAANTIETIISTLTGVDSVTNAAPTTLGADLESDAALRARALANPALRGKGTINAIQSQLAQISTAAHVLQNTDKDTTADDEFHNGTGTGTDSPEANFAQSERHAVKFTVPTGGRWIQDFRLKVKHGTLVPTITLRVETDSAGFPTGALAHSNLEKTGIVPNDNADTDIHLIRESFLAAGTYHLVLTPTAGDLKLIGDAFSVSTEVSFYNGASWAASSTIKNANVDVIAGDKSNSVHAYVLGGADLDIATVLLQYVGAGIGTNGDVVQTLQDSSGSDQEIRFSRPTIVTIYADVTVQVDGDFNVTLGPNAVRDAIIKYVGGTDSTGQIHAGLSLGEDISRSAVSSAIQAVPGVVAVTALKLDTVNPPVVAGALGFIVIEQGKIARMETYSTIDVTVET